MSNLSSLAALPTSFRFVLNTVLCCLRQQADDAQSQAERDLAIEAFTAIGPRDALEAMWAGLAVLMTHAAMEAWMDVADHQDAPDEAKSHRRDAVMLTRTSAQLVRQLDQRRRQKAREAGEAPDSKPKPQAAAAPPPTAKLGAAPRQTSAPAAPGRSSAPARPAAQDAAAKAKPASAPVPPAAGAAPRPQVPNAAAGAQTAATAAPAVPPIPGLPAAFGPAAAPISRAGLLASVAHAADVSLTPRRT
jgi:hypothetical protein